MLLDDLSIFIIKEIFDAENKKKRITTWEIAKKYFMNEYKQSNPNEPENKFFTKKLLWVIRRLNNFKKDNLIEINIESDEKVYLINPEKVFKRKHKFCLNNKCKPARISDAIFVKENNGKITVFEI